MVVNNNEILYIKFFGCHIAQKFRKYIELWHSIFVFYFYLPYFLIISNINAVFTSFFLFPLSNCWKPLTSQINYNFIYDVQLCIWFMYKTCKCRSLRSFSVTDMYLRLPILDWPTIQGVHLILFLSNH